MRRCAILLILPAALILGCSTSEVSRVGQAPRAEITYAATAKYPGGAKTSDNFRLTAIDDPDGKKLEIYNVTDTAIGPATVWVNGAFVHRIDGIAPRGSIAIQHAELLQAGPGTSDLAKLDQTARKVEIETRDGLFTVQGPSRKN